MELQKINNLLYSGNLENIKLAFELAKNQAISINLQNWFWLADALNINPKEESPEQLASKLFSQKTLYLAGSLPNAQLPDDVGNLFNLEILDLSANELEQIPAAIGRLNNLHNLNLSENPIAEIPDFMANLSNLKTLSLANSFLQEVPENILTIQSLVYLNLAHNGLETLPRNLATMPHLRYLDVSGNPFNQETIDWLRTLEHINVKFEFEQYEDEEDAI